MQIDLKLREDILKYFPNFEYFNSPFQDLINFTVVNNIVGQQQESFIFYWILKIMKENGDNCTAGLDIGCGQRSHFFTIGLNDYSGEHPIYGGKYIPHIVSKAENVDKIFQNETFTFIVASHILEHVEHPTMTFRKWCKLLKKDGVMILLMPDAEYEIHGWDPTHKTFWTPNDFKDNCISLNSDIMKTEVFNDLNNKFSMNYVGRRV